MEESALMTGVGVPGKKDGLVLGRRKQEGEQCGWRSQHQCHG
jgi:hypothetical protein